MTVKRLPHENVYVRLAPSPIHGVGVFAILPIPRGINVFPGDDSELLWVPKEEIEKLPPAQRGLYVFGLWKGDKVGCPASFNVLTPGWYVNHNDQDPNLIYDLNEYTFFSARDIQPGEELTTNYHAYCDNVV